MSARPRRALLVAIALLGLGLAAFGFASPVAANYDGTDSGVVVGDTTPKPGQTIKVEACCFKPHSVVEIAIHSTPRLLAQFEADANGRVSGEVTVPADLPAGDHTVVMSGIDVNGAAMSFDTPVSVAARQTSGGGLPRTGAAIGSMVGAGLVLIGGGVLLSRVRRTGTA
jgi:hypothetical protein